MDDDQDGTAEGDAEAGPKSLLPYDAWMEDAMRQVVVRALTFAARDGLPGGHHFYVTFQTDHAGVSIPKRLLAQYPQEMTIVLQHQFWDLKVDEVARIMSVGLSFGGVPSQLVVPFDAISAFADPEVQYGLRFSPVSPPPPEEASPAPLVALAPPALSLAKGPGAAPSEVVKAGKPADAAAGKTAGETGQGEDDAQVVSLDAFRRRPKE